MRLSFALLALLPTLLVDTSFCERLQSEKSGCLCDPSSSHVTQLTDAQMRKQVEHVEMDPDLMGNHVNVRGVAVMRVTLATDGRLLCVRVVSGHPIAVAHLMSAAPRWRFHPYLRNGVAVESCGRVKVKFRIVENIPTIEVR